VGCLTREMLAASTDRPAWPAAARRAGPHHSAPRGRLSRSPLPTGTPPPPPHRHPALPRHLLHEVADLLVRVPVVGVPHLRPPAEERVRLVEEQDLTRPLGTVEEP